jgi:hypothetical protein
MAERGQRQKGFLRKALWGASKVHCRISPSGIWENSKGHCGISSSGMWDDSKGLVG